MKPTSKPSKGELSRLRILEAAGRALRRAGSQGASVGEVMKEAGLTHGGFYAHFQSRDDMVANAIIHAGEESTEQLLRGVAALQNKGMSPLRALVEAYLSNVHMRSAETGCVVAALGSEMPRLTEPVRQAAAQRVRVLVGLVESALPAGSEANAAFEIASTMVGALQMARVIGGADGRKLLEATRSALLARHD